MTASKEQRRAIIVMALLSFLWGYSWVVAKLGLSQSSPLDFSVLRVLVAIVTILVVLIVWRRRLPGPPPPGSIIVGLVQTGLFLTLNNLALAASGPGKISILTFTMPFWVLLFAWPVLGEHVRGRQWIAVGAAIAGLLLILEPWRLEASTMAKVLAVAGGMCWAIGVVISKRIHRKTPVDALDFTFWQMVFGAIPMLFITWIVVEPAPRWTPLLWIALLFSGGLATAVGWLMWQYVLSRLPAGTTSLSSLAVPLIATVSSAIQLGERLRTAEIIGAACIVVALALMSWQSIRNRQRDEPTVVEP